MKAWVFLFFHVQVLRFLLFYWFLNFFNIYTLFFCLLFNFFTFFFLYYTYTWNFLHFNLFLIREKLTLNRGIFFLFLNLFLFFYILIFLILIFTHLFFFLLFFLVHSPYSLLQIRGFFILKIISAVIIRRLKNLIFCIFYCLIIVITADLLWLHFFKLFNQFECVCSIITKLLLVEILLFLYIFIFFIFSPLKWVSGIW